MRELRRACCECIELRRVIKRAAVAAKVAPAEVIGHDQNDIGTAFTCEGEGGEEAEDCGDETHGTQDR